MDLMFYLAFPFIFFTGVILLILSSILVSKVTVSFVNLIHKPKEGIFNRNKYDKDYCYWSLRSIIKKWPVWLARQLSLPLFETIAFKILGVKTSFSNSLNEAWVDCEFVEFGKNVRCGQGSLIMSNIIVQDKLIIKKVIIKDNVIIGAHAVILPGTVIEQNTILDVISMTTINQYLQGDSLYRGVPARKVEKKNDLSNNIEALETLIFEKSIGEKVNVENLRAHVKELSVPFHFYIITGWIIIGCSFIIPGFLFILFLFGLLVPNTFSTALSVESYLSVNIIILLLIPLIIIGLYLLHLFFVALFTKWFYKLADKRGPEQGIYDRNLDESSTILDYYHFGSFLFKYPIFAFIRSPFPWLINWELKFIGSTHIGKNTTFEETFFHSHINFGKNCYMGTFTHITNHVVDGVYGEENLTFFGANVGNNCILSASNGALPGLEMGDNSTILPMCATIKYDKLGNNGIYGGFPAKKLEKHEIKEFFGGEYNGE